MTQTAGPVLADFPTSSGRLRLSRALLNCVLFLAACAAGCAVVGRLAPFPEVPGVYPKFRYFREHRDEFDVLFLGSSRFYHQIIPSQFDAAVGKVRSFNFGYDGMWPPESYYLLRQLLALRPARLKWVFIDLMDINTQLEERNESTLRTAYWHDLQHTALAFRDILSSRFHWWQKRDQFVAHARLCAGQLLNLGRGADLMREVLSPKPPRRKPFTWEADSGFEPEPDRPMAPAKLSEYQLGVKMIEKGLDPVPVRPVFRDALRELIAELRQAKVEPIFVIAPTINRAENFHEIPEGAAVIALNDPREYPRLFDPGLHYDAWHLNAKGAVEFTAILAQRFIEGGKNR